jgi:hypothetical protein
MISIRIAHPAATGSMTEKGLWGSSGGASSPRVQPQSAAQPRWVRPSMRMHEPRPNLERAIDYIHTRTRTRIYTHTYNQSASI